MEKKNINKRLSVLLLLVLTLGFTAFIKPAAVNAEETVSLDYKIIQLDGEQITVVANGEEPAKIYVDTYIGTSSNFTKETYKFDSNKKAVIDLQYLKGKKAKLVIYSDNDKEKAVTVEISAKAKTKAAYDKVNEKLVVSQPSGVTLDKVMCLMGNETEPKKAGDIDFRDYYKKGASGIVYVVGESPIASEGEEGASEITTVSKVEVKPDSKEAKIKIPAQKKGPSIKIDVEKVSFKLPKGCTYEIIGTDGTAIASESATGAAKVINIEKAVSEASVNLSLTKEQPDAFGEKTSVLIEVYKNGTEKALPSKITEVYLPVQKTITAEGDDSVVKDSGIHYEKVYNKSGLKMTGVLVTNSSSDIYQTAVIGKDVSLGDIDLTTADKAKKVKWKTLKPGKTAKYGVKALEDGAHVIYRIKGVKAKKNVEMVLPSTIVMDPTPVEIDKAPAKTVNITLSATPHNGQSADGSSSSSALSVAEITDVSSYVYAVVDKEVKNVKIGTKKTDLSGTEALDSERKATVKGKAKQWVVVYALDGDDNVVSFGCKKLTKDLLY